MILGYNGKFGLKREKEVQKFVIWPMEVMLFSINIGRNSLKLVDYFLWPKHVDDEINCFNRLVVCTKPAEDAENAMSGRKERMGDLWASVKHPPMYSSIQSNTVQYRSQSYSQVIICTGSAQTCKQSQIYIIIVTLVRNYVTHIYFIYQYKVQNIYLI